VTDIDIEIDVTSHVVALPSAFRESLPFIFDEVYSSRRFPPSLWWLGGLVLTGVGVLLVTIVAQVTLSLPSWVSSGWGQWVAAALPAAVLVLLALLVTFRVWGHFASHTQVREEMLGNILSLLDRQTIALGEDARTT
jgi:hypothetical protein